MIIAGRTRTIIQLRFRIYLKGVIPLDHVALLFGFFSTRFLLHNVWLLKLGGGQSVPYCKSGITIRNQHKIFFIKRASKCLQGLCVGFYMLAITKIGFLGSGKETCKPRVLRYMDILAFQTIMLEVSYMGGVIQFMSANYMCANAKDRLANQDLTPRWLNLI